MSLVLVDGSNVARCGAWRARNDDADDVTLRRRLVDAISSWAAREAHATFITFDGAGPWRPGSVAISDAVEVFGTGGVEGDDVLARRAIEAVRARESYWLVTSDRALGLLAGGGADRSVSADEFVELLAPAARTPYAPGEPPSPTRLRDTMTDDVRSRLERMRRGLDPDG